MTRIGPGAFSLNVKRDGDANAPWIILSNSLGAGLSMWDGQIRLLTSKYQVLRYDTRGHGQSDVPDGPYSLADLQGDVLGLMDHFNIGQADWLGLSMGAMTGMGLAIQNGNRFGKMVFADARADAPAGFRKMWDERCGLIAEGGTEAIVDGTMATWLTADFQAGNPDITQQLKDMIRTTPDAGYIACAQALKNLDYLKSLGTVRNTALYIGGAEDPGAPPAVMQEMADATPGAKYRSIPNAAHIANINAPDDFNNLIAAFLEL